MITGYKKKHILLVDDSRSFLKSMRLALEKIGFQCKIAESLPIAIEMMELDNFDLIVCDYFMPECDGRSALDSLGRLDKNCPLVLTSAYPLDIEFKKTDRFIFIDKLGLYNWLSEKYVEVQYAQE
jgi:two-component system, NtrC family, response regulator HydG